MPEVEREADRRNTPCIIFRRLLYTEPGFTSPMAGHQIAVLEREIDPEGDRMSKRGKSVSIAFGV